MGKERESPPAPFSKRELKELPPEGITRREVLTWLGLGIATTILVPPTVRKILEKLGMSKAEATSLAESLVQVIRCDIKVLDDFDPRYDINVDEVKRLLENNGIVCPYWVNIELTPKPLWVKKEEEGIKFSMGKAGCFADFCLVKISTTDMELRDTEGHDFTFLKTLKGIERHNWIAVHESAPCDSL